MSWVESAWWDHVALLALPVGVVACLIFVVRYQTLVGWGWWRDAAGRPNYFGRFMMTRKALLGTLFSVVLAGRVATDRVFQEVPDGFPGQGMLMALLFWAFALQTFIPYRLLLIAQQEIHGGKRSDDVQHRSGHGRPERGRK